MVNNDIACDPLDPRENTTSDTMTKAEKKVDKIQKKLSRKLQRVETRRKVEEMLYLQAEDDLLGDPFADTAFI